MSIVLDLVDSVETCGIGRSCFAAIWQADIKFLKAWMKDTEQSAKQLCRLHACQGCKQLIEMYNSNKQ